MTFRRAFRVCVLLGLLAPNTAAAQIPTPPTEFASVGISPSYQEVSPGAQLAFTVSALSTLGGTVLVTIGPGMTLMGDPVCSGPCGGPFVTAQAGATIVEVTLEGEDAVIGFNVALSSEVVVGDTLNINVTLVGGPQAVEMSSATIYVSSTPPTQVPPVQAPESPEDNRLVYVEVSPFLLRLAPGGDVLFHIQPVRWGVWSGSSPNINLDITVPSGLAAASEFYCGRGDLIPTQNPCGTTTSENADGSTTYSISPGYSMLDESTNGVYLLLEANSDVEEGASLQVKVLATVEDETLPEQPAPVTSTIQVVSTDSLLTPQDSLSSVVGATFEVREGFSRSGSTCSRPLSSSQVGLYEVGLETRFSATAASSGRIDVASDGSGTEVCLVPIVFDNVPTRDIYVLATSYGDDLPCRACVYGLITTTHNAEVMFPSQQ